MSRDDGPVASVDHDLCAGVAMCTRVAPMAFRLNDAGQAVFRQSADASPKDIQMAVDSCPMAAIAFLTPAN